MPNNENKTTEAQRKAVKKYKENNMKRISVEFYPADQDLYEHLSKQSPKQAYIKSLIRADMEKNK